MQLPDLLEEVIEGHILPLLEWNDLLRFRRVCKTIHEVTTKYLKIHPELAPEIEITEEGDRSLKAFMEMGIPTTKLFLDTEYSGYRFYEKNAKDVDCFLELYGSTVKSLRVKELTLLIHGKELEFLGGLVNLENLEADYFGAGTGSKAVTQEELAKAHLQCKELASKDPDHLKKSLPHLLAPLKRLKLKIGQKQNLQTPYSLLAIYQNSFVSGCQGLEYLSLPFNTLLVHRSQELPEEFGDSTQAMALAFFYLHDGLTRTLTLHQQINLKVIDLASYHDMLDEFNSSVDLMRKASPHFLKLCAVCLEHDVRLMNVEPFWFIGRKVLNLPPELMNAELGKVVVSLVNMKQFVLDMDMPNLERIEIRHTSQSITLLLPGQARPAWPNLKSLEIYVDSVAIKQLINGRGEIFQTTELFNFFFKDIRRLALVELCLKFKEGEEQVAVPKVEDIVSACPNLKKLRIVNWPGTNKALIKLWSGIPGLEEITLENCKQLGNVAFVGENIQKPVFFKLKKLTKLSLKGLDLMPKITDTLFSLVIRHLKLTHLSITSNSPVSSVTLAGVESLLTGPFKDSIEKFPFRGWSLENVTDAEFKAVEKKFRCCDML